jgi:hypothetical protein
MLSGNNDPPPTLSIKSQDFYAGYRDASGDFETKYKCDSTGLDDIEITTILLNLDCDHKTDLWKTGYLAGFFASLYGIPYTWMVEPMQSFLYYGRAS